MKHWERKKVSDPFTSFFFSESTDPDPKFLLKKNPFFLNTVHKKWLYLSQYMLMGLLLVTVSTRMIDIMESMWYRLGGLNASFSVALKSSIFLSLFSHALQYIYLPFFLLPQRQRLARTTFTPLSNLFSLNRMHFCLQVQVASHSYKTEKSVTCAYFWLT